MRDTESDMPLPPATFHFLIASLTMQAQMHLGALHFGKPEDRPEPDLPLSRHAIDMLAMLQDKTRGNLTMEEQRELENSLTELRFRYVQAVEEAGRAKQAGEPAPGTEASTEASTEAATEASTEASNDLGGGSGDDTGKTQDGASSPGS